MATEEKIIDLRVKQLEMIQAVITRMAGYSASLKNYCLTIVAAIASASVTLKDPRLLLFALISTLVFGALDARYLQLERRFRGRFDMVRAENWAQMPDFDVSLSTAPKRSYSAALFNWSIILFYGLLLIGNGLIVFALRAKS